MSSQKYIGTVIVYYSTSNHKVEQQEMWKIKVNFWQNYMQARAFWRNGSYAPVYKGGPLLWDHPFCTRNVEGVVSGQE